MVKPRGARSLWLLVVIIALLAGVGIVAAADAQKTYIEFVFDASFSMNEEAEKGKSRMDVAKEVMIDLIQNLEDRSGLEVGLRVYGSRNTSCDDSVLVQDFGPVDAVRGNILKIVRGLKPRGKTPIAYSLEQAAQDFPSKESRNIIVLITDGEESCGGDPCAVSYYLQSQGIIYRPHVVGFAMSSTEEAKVSCIGTYYSAKDRKSLSEALGSIMRKVVAPSQLEIEAWAGGENVTSQTVFEIVDSSGDTIDSGLMPKGDTLRRELAAGTYGVEGVFQVGSLSLEASQSRIELGEGESKLIRLDFGDLEGTITIIAKAGGKNVSDRVDIDVEEAGRAIVAKWSGVPPKAALKAGTYTFTVVLPLADGKSLSKQVQGRVAPGEATMLEVDLGELMASLEVEVTYRDTNVTADTRLEILRDGAKEASFGTGSQLFRHSGAPGEVDLKVTYVGDVNVEKRVSGIVLSGGERTRVTVKLDDLLGTLRVKVKAGDRDVTSKSEVTAQGERHKLQLSPKGDLVVTIIPAGFYGVQAMYQRSGSNLAEVTVGAGQITDVTLEVDVPGRIILVPMLGDKPAPLRKVQAWFYRTAGQETAFEADEDRLTASMRAGAYDLRAQYEGVPVQVRTLENLQVRAGESQEVKVVFDPVGRLRVKLTSDGKPYKAGDPWLMLYPAGREFDSDDYLTDLEKVEKGVYELELKEGSYDIKITHIGEGFSDKKFYDFEIKGGKLREEILDVGDSGTLRIKLVSGGKPHREGRIMVYEPGTEFGEYVCDLEEVEKGVYENKLKEGNYDIQLINLGAGFPDKKFRDVEVVGGSTTEKTLELGGLGRLRIKLVSAGKPHREGRIMVYEPGTEFGEYVCDLEEVEKGVYENKLKEGNYDIQLINLGAGFPGKKLYDVEVVGGSTTEKTLELGGIGRIQVRLIGEEKYEWVRLMLYTVDDNDYVCDLEPDGSGRWVARLREGEYKLEITDGFNNQWVRDLIVEPDGTLEKSITLSLGDDDWDDDDDWDSWETDDDWDDDDWDSWDNDDDWDDNDDW